MSCIRFAALLAAWLGSVPPVFAQQGPKFHKLSGGHAHGIAFVEVEDPPGVFSLRGAVATDGGHLTYSQDGGVTWLESSITDDTNDEIRGQMRGIFFLDQDHGWAVGDGGVVLFTADQGQTWQWPNRFSPIYDWTEDPENIGQLLNKKAELYDIVMFNDQDGWAVGNDGALVYTTDGWTTHSDPASISVPDEWTLELDPRDLYDLHWFSTDPETGVGIVSSEYGTFLRTTDGGSTWNPIAVPNLCYGNTGVHPNLELWSMEFVGSEGWSVGGHSTNYGQFLHSLDSGLTWQQSVYIQPAPDNPPTQPTSFLLAKCAPVTLYGLAVVDPASSAVTAIGYESSVFDWSPSGSIGLEFNQCDCAAGLSLPSGNPSWIQTQPLSVGPAGHNPPLTDVFVLGPQDRWLCGRFGSIRRWESGSWVEKTSTHYFRLTAGDFHDASTGCVFGEGLRIKRTTDGGATWQDPTFTSWTPDDVFIGKDLDLSSVTDRGFAIANPGFLARSGNLGSSWLEVAGPSPQIGSMQTVCIAPGGSWSSERVYIGGGNGRVWWTDLNDPQLVWNNVSIPGTAEMVKDLAFTDQLIGYAVGTGLSAWSTSDGGDNWSAIEVAPAPGATDLLAVATWGDGSQAVAVGTGGHVFGKLYDKFRRDWTAPSVTVDLLDVEAFWDVTNGLYMVVGGDQGTVLLYENLAWSAPKSQTSEKLFSVSFVAPGSGYLIGQQFAIAKYE